MPFLFLIFLFLLILIMFWLWPVARIKPKTHDRFQPWVLVKTGLRSTSANGVVRYNDDNQHDNL